MPYRCSYFGRKPALVYVLVSLRAGCVCGCFLLAVACLRREWTHGGRIVRWDKDYELFDLTAAAFVLERLSLFNFSNGSRMRYVAESASATGCLIREKNSIGDNLPVDNFEQTIKESEWFPSF